MEKKVAVFICSLVVTLAGVGFAQKTPPAMAPRPAAPAASATPGATPAPAEPEVDPWTNYLKEYYKIHKVPKDRAVRISPEYAYPHPAIRMKMEVVHEDDKYLYLRNLPIEDPESSSYNAWLLHESREASYLRDLEEGKSQFVLDPEGVYVPPPFTDRIHLEEASAGLPNSGRWQMGLAVADMNGDGKVDIVLPPARLGTPLPSIYLQKAGGWELWKDARWPSLKLDYGDVAVADFDGDGNLDIAIACHFLPSYVLYGNGKGDFTRAVELPRVSKTVTSRALSVADFDGDGRPDVALLAELDLDMATNETLGTGLLQVTLNRVDGWKAVDATMGEPNLFGDHLAVGDFNADGRPDLWVSSHKNVFPYWVYLNKGDGTAYVPTLSSEFPYLAYNLAVATGNLDGKPGDEAVSGFAQNPYQYGKSNPMNGLAVFSFAPVKDGVAVTRKLLEVDRDEYGRFSAATVGDVDGDGRGDLVVGRQNGQLSVYLQTVGGDFLKDNSPEIKLGDAYVNDVHVVTLATGDRAILVDTSDGRSTPGGVHCFLVKKGALDSANAER